MITFRFIFTLVGIAGLILVIGVAFSADKPAPKKAMKDILAGLPNTNAAEAQQIASQFSAERAELERELVRQLASPKSKLHQVVVVYLLGLYRMDSAARDIAEVITLEMEPTRHKRLPLLSRYPAADALTRIGMPSIPAVIGRLEKDDRELVVELGTKVINRILGRELGEMAIKQAIDKQTDRDKRKKLEEALEFFKNKLRR